MPLSRTRRGQTQGVLNYDTNMYAKVVDLERQRVAMFQEETAGECVQLNQEVVQQVEQIIAQLKIILDKKKNEADAIVSSNRQIQKVTNTEELLNAYDQIATVFGTPGNSPYTKQAIWTKVMEPQRLVGILRST